VAERICARVGERDYSLLSVIVSAGFHAEAGFVVGPNNFSPRPKVDSQVIKLVPNDNPLSPADIKALWRVVSTAFSQRRKTLRNTLSHLPSLGGEELAALSSCAGIDLGDRPQNISIGQYHLFSKSYDELLKKQP
jgi:16S rRNA (adenine1518-N6/adenine1519-N6)-dimethyltransferase